MNLVQRASSLVFPAYRFGDDDPAQAEKLVDLSVGGFCLYGGTRDEVFALTQRLQKRARNPLLFCADYEDGPGAWISGGTRFPSNMAIGAAGSAELARLKGRLTAVESRALGVDWVLAPVVDLATRGENPIVNLRAFGDTPERVAELAGAYLQGLADGGCLPSVKHFPGHGETTSDSHLVLPDLDVDLPTLMKRELKPFIALKQRAGTVMIAHLKVKALDPDLPASLSKRLITGLLKDQVGFGGLIVTDALSMNAIAGTWTHDQQASLALHAGAEVLLVPDDPFAFQRAVLRTVNSDASLEPVVMAASEKLIEVKKALGLFASRGLVDPKGLEAVGSPAHAVESARMSEAALAWGRGGPAPLKGAKAVRYLEPENDPADWEGRAFLDELAKSGVRVAPWTAEGEGPAVVAVFSRPQAYLGTIGLMEEQLAAARQAAGSDPSASLVCFGTPFAARQVGAPHALCTFSDLEASQRAAARCLLGLAQARGKAPVTL